MQIKRINLALQGGGAHGAFTWGVLDRMLDEERLEVEAISGTSAGAMNAARWKCSGATSARPPSSVPCLPFLFQAVTIDGDPYWDGGCMGNPAIFPLIYGTDTSDVVIIQINPLGCDRVPTTATEIMNRLNEISFNSSLMREMRAISFVTDLIDQGKLDSNQYRRINVHWIEAEQQMKGLGVSSKLNARMDFLLHLKEIGRQVADRWIATHFDAIGERSTIDIKEKFL